MALCVLLIGFIFTASAQEAAPFTPRLNGGSIDMRGDIIFVGNNILNRASQTDPSLANTPYNGTENNNSLWMEYIDIDGDSSTFSSSSSELNIPDPSCSQVRYAGLYWAATYPNERSTDGSAQFTGTQRIEDWFNIKFKVPGGSYIDLTADTAPDPFGEEDDIIFDGYDYSNINNSFKDSPYICYKNITDLVRANPNPNGEYTIANIRATKGVRNGSSSAGWVMVVIYENPSQTGKFISLFDGYAGLSGSIGSVDVNVNGFKTLPSGFPVNARLAVGALEGDRSITNDRFALKANMTATFTDLSTTNLNPANNFFNSTISDNDNQVSTRTPFGTNTLGLDLDIFDLNNPSNSILPNDETGATMRFTSTGDGYGAFLAAFLVEQIEPEIVLEKRVEDIGGNDITGLGVNLGQTLDYVLTFQNIGNDDTVNYTIRDVLPINVTLDEANLVLPIGVTYSFDEPTRTIVFTIPDGLVQENDPEYSIRMRVKVAENCYDFVDACSDQILNLAFSTYSGAVNTNIITDDPSVHDFNTCGFVVPGATNFLLDDLNDCTFSSSVQLCGEQLILNVGDGFDEYVWYRDENGNNQIDATDSVLDDGDPDNDASTLVVERIGTYLVDKIVADPCKGFVEIINVELYGATQTNPIVDYFNNLNGDTDPTNNISGEIVSCSIDGSPLPKIFLCGVNDTQLLQVAISDAASISWELLVEGSCSDSGDNCANKNATCTWNPIASGSSYTANTAGKFRLVVNYQNGCFSRFYFNVFQNDLDIQYNKKDIICANPGNITITNLGNGYGYQLVNAVSGAILIPFSANNGPNFSFNPGQNGGYRVEVVQLDNSSVPIGGACIFSTPNIGILDRNVTYAVTATPASCTGFGSINIQINNADPNYGYEIRLDDGSNGGLGKLVDSETAQPDNNFTFSSLNPGNYIAIARTADGCSYSEKVTIVNNNDLYLKARVSQHITCKEGNILMDSGGGKTPHTYAIWSYVDNGGATVISYPSVNDIPASVYQTSQIFDIYDPGDYTFAVVDRFNCVSISNTVTIEFRPAAEFDPTSVIDVLCYGDSSGTIRFNLVNSNGYQLTYYLFDAATFDEENYDYNNALATNSSGNFPGLSAGDYAIVINQRKGSASCDYFEYHTISAPANALDGIAVLIQDYSCLQDGIIEAQNVTGGIAPYEYSIDGVNFFSGPGAERFTGLTEGTYSITIRDAVGCVMLTDPIILNPLNRPSDLIFVSSQPVCPTLVSDVTVTVVDGNVPFTYEIIAPASDVANNGSNATFTGLSPKTYTFQVTDDKGCTIQESYTIAPIVPIGVNGQLMNNVSCFGLSDGAITFNVGNFNSSYDYVVTGPLTFSDTGVTTNTVPLTGLAEGTYNITITDTDTNCLATTSVTVNAPPSSLLIASMDVTEISCTSTGAVTITASGGWGGYEYELMDPSSGSSTGPQGNNTFSGLNDTSGNYTVTVRDAGGCEVAQNFVFTPSPPPVLELIANNLCYDSTVGLSLTANVLSGGTAPFQYRLNGGAYQSGNNFTGLGPGNYTVEVIDSKSCTDVASLEIFPTLTATSNLIKGLDCSVSPEAEIEISIADGSPNYAYEVYLDGTLEQTSTMVPSIPFSYAAPTAGTYTFNITDAGGCTVSTTTTVDQYVLPSISLIQTTEILCNGENGGTIQVNIDGTTGLPPYTISVVNITTGTAYGQQTSGLPAGEYEVTVTDSKSCSDTETIIIEEPDPIAYDIVVTPIMCDPSNGTDPGSISVTNISGGTNEYTYYLTGNNGHSDSYTTTSAGEDHTFTILEFGIYEIDVVDANGCSVRTTNIIASPPDDLDINVSTATVDCNLGGTAIITVNSVLGSGYYEFAVLETYIAPYVDDPINDYQSADTPGGDTATFTGLLPGITYSFVVHDLTSNCYYFETADLPIDSPSNLTTSLDAINNVTCTGNADGNVSFTIDDFAPDATNVNYEVFNFQSNSTTGIMGSVIVNPPSVGSGVSVTDVGPLVPGTYYVLFNEVGGSYDGCSVGSEVFTISESTNPLQVTASLIKNDNCNSNAGQVAAIGQFGTAPYEYQIALSTDTPPTVATWTGSSTNVFNVEGGNYIVYIKDANNCIQQDTVVVPTDPSPEISLAVNNQCLGSEGNYAIDITLTTAGITPYSVRVDGGAPRVVTGLNTVGSMITIPGLNSGSHTIEILDSNGCGEMQGIIIAPELQASALVMVQPSCSADDGVIEFTVNGGSGSYLIELLNTDSSPSGITPIGNQFTGVPFGDYVVRVTDNLLGTPNCYIELPISLEEPTPITLLSTAWTDVSCFGGSDGSINVNLEPSSIGVNDNPPYVYEITNGASSFSQSSGVFTGLAAGVWDITVTSNRNCIAVDQVTIGEPTALMATITNVTPFGCDVNNAPQMAIIEVTITSGTGTPNYFYSVNGGNFRPTSGTVFTYEALNAGNYDIVIRDANGCLFVLPTQTIEPLNTFTASISQISAISCAGPEEIVITVTDDGNPTNSYSFELLPLGNPNGILTGTPTNTSASFNLNAVGNYSFRITDLTTGCYIDTVPYDIAPYDLMDISATANSPVTCFGDGNGIMDLQITGYSGTYDYEVFTQTGVSIRSVLGNSTTNPLAVNGLSGGNYYIRVTQTEFPYCSDDSNVITISSPNMPLTAIVDPVAEARCTDNMGEILVAPSGGYAPYDIVLTNTTTGQVYNVGNVGTMLFTGLSAGNFNVQVTDNFGCVYLDAEVLSPAVPIVANAIPLTTMLNCYNDNNATVTAIVTSGGSGNYEYRLNYYDDAGSLLDFTSGEQTSNTFTGLGAGIYSITVTDGWNCDVETNQVTITQPPMVFASLVRTDPLTCATGAEFELTAIGGSGTYEYSFDNITFLPMTSNPMGIPASGVLGAGTYQYYVRDAINGCEAIVSNAITENPIEPLILTVNKTAAYINCTGENTAVIRAEASGGLGNYQFELYLNSITAPNRLAGPQDVGEFKDLVAGTYWVNVISEDCTTAPEQVIIEEPVPLTYADQVVDVSCFGEENGSITVNLAGGAGGYIYSISPNLDKFDSINTFTDLAPGDYAVIAQDQNGCFEYLEYTISEPAVIEGSAITTPETCIGNADGSINLSISGGTAPYRTAINSNTDTDYILGRTDFSDLSAGDYLIFIKDAQDCETYIVATIDPGVNLRATVEPVYECIGNSPNNYVNIILEDQSLLSEVMYGLDTTDPEDMQLDPNFRNIASGNHYITITHANGCIETVGFLIENYDPLTLTLEQRNVNEITAVTQGGRLEYTFYLNGIDMGGDNTFRIRRTGTYEVRVVDENGCEAIANIFMEFVDIKMPNFYTPNGDGMNDLWRPGNAEYFSDLTVKIYDRYGRVVARLSNIDGWDGTYDGKELPTGDYWYVVQFNEEDYQREFFGHFTLYR
ncbi:hypothetical protein DHD32_16160 [Arenibacter sp. TNZ]|nr:hypothetical protein [Arenibacter sp. TNZ]